MVAAGAKSVVSKGMAGLFLYRQIKAGVENLPLLPNARLPFADRPTYHVNSLCMKGLEARAMVMGKQPPSYALVDGMKLAITPMRE
jgi:hypothetical protein